MTVASIDPAAKVEAARYKVAIAIALVRQVSVLLLNEPTSGLDPRATADLRR